RNDDFIGMDWDGLGWDWDGLGWTGMGLGWTGMGLGWTGMDWDGIGMDWDGLGRTGMGLGWEWDGLGWTGMDWDEIMRSRLWSILVQFRPYRTDDFITRLYYETPRLTVLNQTWVLKARVNDSERNPNLSCKRTLSFQLILKSKVQSPMECSFLLLEGPYDDVKINPVIYHFVFSNESNETDYMALPIVDSVECNKLLAAKNINLRLFIFQIQK
ncbi:Cysteine and histidine-rich protein 1, partial [Lamprotornis superbus]